MSSALQRPPTPRMMGGKIPNELRRDKHTNTVNYDQTRFVQFVLTFIYTVGNNGNPGGDYRGARIDAVLTSNKRRGKPIMLDSWLHERDAAKMQQAREALDLRRFGTVSFEDEGAYRLLYGFEKHGANQQTVWVTGILDRLGHLVGIYSGALLAEYPSKEEYENAKRDFRTSAPEQIRTWKMFRARVLRTLIPRMAAMVRESQKKYTTQAVVVVPARPRAARRTAPTPAPAPTTTGDTPSVRGMNKPVVQKMVAFLRQNGSSTPQQIAAGIKKAGHKSNYMDASKEISTQFAHYPHIFMKGQRSAPNGPFLYGLTPEFQATTSSRPAGRRS